MVFLQAIKNWRWNVFDLICPAQKSDSILEQNIELRNPGQVKKNL